MLKVHIIPLFALSWLVGKLIALSTSFSELSETNRSYKVKVFFFLYDLSSSTDLIFYIKINYQIL